MKRILCLSAVLALCACAPTVAGVASAGAGAADVAGVPAPVTYADQTTLDDQAITGLELAYKAARIACETGVDSGLIKGATAASIAEYDNKAFLALSVARGAYRTGNAVSYKSALSEAETAITGLLSLTGKTGANP